MPRPTEFLTRCRAAVVALVLVATTSAVGFSAEASAAPPPPPPKGPKAQPAPPGTTPLAAVVVKVAAGHTVDEVTAGFPVVVEDTVLASRGIYLVRATDPRYKNDPKKAAELATTMSRSRAVEYAEQNYDIELSDDRYHAWGDGTPVEGGDDAAAYQNQPLTTRLQLPLAHAISTGSGQTIAVLDTGVDASHPALAGKVTAGYDYVDDDDDPSDDPGGDASGHGTFVSGIATLVAPGARIRGYRVLDSSGHGNTFAVTLGILDALADGATVINMSLGVADKIESKSLSDAIKQARKQKVLIVGAAGNDGGTGQQFPAASPEAIGVTALTADGNNLASFANRGNWIDIAAPGESVVGPMPGGHYAAWAGTSMATPIVAGEVALLRDHFPGLDTPKLVEKLIKHTSRLNGRYTFGAADPLASLQAK